MKLVATDLDGTIVRADGTVSPRVVAAFDACRASGVDVVFVTGRPPRWMAPIAEATGHRGTAVCGNGAIVWDLGAERVLRSRTLPPELVRDVVARVRTVLGDASFALETLEGFVRERDYRVRWDAETPQRVGDLDDLLELAPSVVKVLVRQEASTGDAMLAEVLPALDGVAQATHSNVNDCLVEVAAPGVSKASTLAELAAERGVDAGDVVAFGDMPNDLEMLRWAGRGYAMQGGHPHVLAAADATAPPCEQDGVAQVLEDLLRGMS